MQNCAYKVVSLNGVIGGEFTGSNENTIFLPFAGYKIYTGVTEKHNEGNYLTGTKTERAYIYLLDLSFDNSNVGWMGIRYLGYSVRPVSK